MSYMRQPTANCNLVSKRGAIPLMGGVSFFSFPLPMSSTTTKTFFKGHILSRGVDIKRTSFARERVYQMISRKVNRTLTRCSNTGSDSKEDSPSTGKTPFGYSRKDVLLIGVGVTLLGIGLKSGLEYFGVDPLQAGNVVQLILVLGLTIGWISTYIFRVSNKEMTYAQQLRDYERKVMEKRLEGLSEAELEVLLEQVEEEKRSVAGGEKTS
ncbi:uncharacterized protein LOC124919083 [Impatiens glandulifera]|uniref:uncharacterized protein LOC124919083 n=1 Tax=Impatiens glandulifera TaxID=253017 RepID=UPI001FB0EFDF|nr:uncharacterized protein LOC124919083 [Impatiens glandulifera]